MTCLAFLESLVDVELQDRGDRRLKRGLAMAHFPVVKRLEDFKVGRVSGIAKRDLSELAECSWIDRHEICCFSDPQGSGKRTSPLPSVMWLYAKAIRSAMSA